MPEGLRPRMRWRIDYNEAVAAADAPSSRPNRPAGRQGLTELTAVAAVTAMRGGDLKAEDYAHALLDRAHHLESLNAFRTLDKEMVLEAARAADKVRARGDAMGLLHGIPIPVKDSIDSKALPTSNGTRALRDFRPRDDADRGGSGGHDPRSEGAAAHRDGSQYFSGNLREHGWFGSPCRDDVEQSAGRT